MKKLLYVALLATGVIVLMAPPAMAQEEKPFTLHGRTFIRDQRMSSKLSLRKAAGLAGVSIPYLSQIERGLRKPSAEILQAIAKGLRISAETLYVQAGILEEKPIPNVAAAVMADMTITESQKKALLQIYEAFREGTGRTPTPEVPQLAAIGGGGAGSIHPGEPGAGRGRGVTTTRAGRPTAKRKGPKSTTTSPRGGVSRGGGKQAGGGTGSQAGSSPHPAPTRSPAPN